jgi:hypothetical protein
MTRNSKLALSNIKLALQHYVYENILVRKPSYSEVACWIWFEFGWD